MSSVSGGATVIVDKDGGDAVTVTGSRLDVNAYLSATPTIDIGDVSLLLGGTAASVNNGSADATTLRVTVADNSTGVLSIDDNGGSLTIDGTVTANLSAVDNAVLDSIQLVTVAVGAAITDVTYDEDATHTSADEGLHILSVRNDIPTQLAATDGDYQSFQTSAKGGLYVEQLVYSITDTFAMIVVDNAVETLSSNTGTITDISEMFLQADEDNSGYIMIGDADVADNRGMKLNPGDTLILDNSDSRTVSLWGSEAGQNLRCMFERRST
jgi:hypothetical protein